MRATDPPDELDNQDAAALRQVSEDRLHRRVARPGPWRVFVSHTSELREYPRPGASYVDEAERAVSAVHHAIVDMADFAAADQTPASLCIEKVRNCDVYVGIFGLRYGSPVRDRPEVSYTELEFDTATKLGLPRLVFLVDGDSSELVGLPARALIDREFGDRQDAFMRRVSDCGLTLRRFRNPDELARLVERSLHALAERGAIRQPPVPPPAPSRPTWTWPTAWDFSAYLHEKRAGFVGRAWLFEEVRAWATNTDPIASQALLISADYGVGKSAFVAELIARAGEDASAHPRGPGIPIAAHHFCTTEQDATLAPGVFVGGLAAQLAEALPAYRQALEAEEARDRRRWLEDAGQDPARAFDQAVLAPLLAIEAPPTSLLLVVDGLDEAQDPRSQGGPAAGDTIVSLLARYANRLPAWLKVLATSRCRPDVLTPLRQTFRLKDLDGEEARNLICLRTYAEGRCQEATLAGRLARAGLSPEEVAAFLCRMEQSRGKFLYLVRVLRDLESGLLPLADRADLEALPPGMDGFYADAFARRFPSADDYTPAGAILAVLCEQREPMGRRELAALLGCAERAISERLQPVVDLLGVRCVTGERRGAAALDGVQAKEVLYSLGHLSLLQWLSEEDDYGLARAGRFAVDRLAATERLRAWALEAVAAGRAHTWPYLVRHLASHLTESERPGVVAGLLGEFAWLEARLRLAGINALLGDLAVATPSPWLRRLERALRQGAHVLSHSAGWQGHGQLASQLLARLADDGAEAERLRGQAEAGLRQAGGARPLATSLEGHEALLRTLPVSCGVHALAALPDGRLASGGLDSAIHLWDPDTGTRTGVLEGHRGMVSALAVLPDGRLASGSCDNTIRLWDPVSGSCSAVLEGHHGGVNTLAALPDGRLASGSSDKTIRLWNPDSGSRTAVFEGHQGEVIALAVLSDGRLASGSNDNTIRLWDPVSGSCSAVWEGQGGVMALAALPDGRLASGSKNNTIHLWDPRSGSCTTVLQGHQGGVSALTAFPDGRLASGSFDNTIRLWNPVSDSRTAVVEGHQGTVFALAVLPDGRLASGSFDNTVRLWDPDSGSRTAVFEGHQGTVFALVVLPDGRLASGSFDNTIRLWDPDSDSRTAEFERHQGKVFALAVLSYGRLASGSDDNTIRLWNPDSGSRTALFEGHRGGVNALAVLPDGRLASGSFDNTIRLWDPDSGSCMAVVEGHQGTVFALAVLPDGRLASGSFDNTIRLWNPDSGACTTVFEGHQKKVTALAMLPDGRLASGSDDNTIRLWDPTRPDGAPDVLFVADADITALLAHPTRPLLVAGDGSGRLHRLELAGRAATHRSGQRPTATG